jgi:large repetitive protein
MRNIRNIFVMIVVFLAFFPDTGIATSLQVTWTADTDSDLAGYKVYWGTASGAYGTPASVTSGTLYDISSVQAGTTYYVAVSAYDTSGNESAKSTQQSITVPASDTTPPTGSITINSGAATTSSTSVTLTLSATDNSGTVTGMEFSNDGTTWSSQVAYATSYSWSLSSGFGTKTVYAKFVDPSGNWSSAVTDTINLVDTTPPTGTVIINSGATSTTSTAVTLTLSATDNSGTVAGMEFSNDGSTWSSQVAYATSYSWTLSSGSGTKTVYAKFVDPSGNWSSVVTATINLVDTTPPTGSVLINGGASTTTSTAVTLTLSASDAAGTVTGMKISNDGTNWTSATYATSYSWTLSSGYGSKTVYALFGDNSGNWMTSPATDTIQYVSSLPVANAGTNQTLNPQDVILDGSASYDPGGGTLQYLWTQVGSSPVSVTINTPTSAKADFVGIKEGTYQFKLTCTNSAGSSSATVNVTINNVAPTVSAGSNVTINAGTQITLHATGADSNQDSLTYQWTMVSGPSVTLPSMTQQNITFTPTTAGLYTFSVTCSDGVNTSAASQVIVTANAVNHAPTANAGVEQDVDKGVTVTLDGTGSTDPDGDTLTYSWTEASSDPVQVTLSGANTAKPTFVATTVGTFNFNLVVNDGTVNSTPSSVVVKVVYLNHPPVANAGPDVSTDVGFDVVLDASGSYDPDLDPLTFTWTQVSGASVVIQNADTMNQAFFTPTTAGVYVFMVTVSDGQLSSTDTMTVTVSNLPVANAGSSIVATVGQTVTLDGSASYDSNGKTISYVWAQTSGTQVSLSNSNTAKPSFTASLAGVYVFQLKVYDGIDTSAASSVTVTVQSAANQITLISPAKGTVCSSSPKLTWAGSGFKSYTAYISINGGTNYTNVYSGSGTSTTLHPVLWQWFIPSGTTVTWYVQGTTTSGQVVKSTTSTFIRK